MFGFTEFLSVIQAHWIVSLLVLAATLIYVHYIYYFGELRRLGISGPKPKPIFGNSLAFLDTGRFHTNFDKLIKQYGKVFGVYFTKQPTIVVSDPEILKTILVKDFNNFHDRPRRGLDLPEPYASMLTIVKGDRWKNIRNILTPGFTTGKLKGVMSIMQTAVDTFLKKCKAAAESGETVDMYKWAQGITMETILSAAFGLQAETQTNPNDPVTKLAKESLTPRKWLLFIAMIPVIGGKLLEYVFKYYISKLPNIQLVAEQVINERKRHGIENDVTMDLLHLMLAAQDPDRKGHKLTDNEVIAQSMVFLLAGYDTSSITLSLTVYHLAINPEIQERVYEEVERVCPGDTICYESIHELVYLDAVISETLRLYPPGFITNRNVSKSCEINGIWFKEHMSVLIPIYSLHHDEEYWEEPEAFKPERFLPGNRESINPFTYLPFGQGPRNCIGLRFAMLELKTVLAKMVKDFQIERAPELHVPLDVKPISLLKPAEPVSVRLKKRVR